MLRVGAAASADELGARSCPLNDLYPSSFASIKERKSTQVVAGFGAGPLPKTGTVKYRRLMARASLTASPTRHLRALFRPGLRLIIFAVIAGAAIQSTWSQSLAPKTCGEVFKANDHHVRIASTGIREVPTTASVGPANPYTTPAVTGEFAKSRPPNERLPYRSSALCRCERGPAL